MSIDLTAAAGAAAVLRARTRVLAGAAWALDSALSARRKSEAGYRAPDPETGRLKEHDGITDEALQAVIDRAVSLIERTNSTFS